MFGKLVLNQGQTFMSAFAVRDLCLVLTAAASPLLAAEQCLPGSLDSQILVSVLERHHVLNAL